jgi:ABC-2 type transport system ATP-binding protein
VNDRAAVVVDQVSKRYRLYHERNQSLKATVLRGRRARYDEFLALDDVSFEVQRGTTFGIIGENGSGKSTMLKCIARILRPDGGHIDVNGKISALLELGAGFHPELSGRENVYLNGAILGLSRRQLDQRFDEIVAFAGIEPFIDSPVKNYSSGMYVRLGFAIAINVDPDILLIDEVLAVGDAEFQRRCTEKITEFREEGRTIVIVTHSLPSVQSLCSDVALLDHGHLVRVGPAGEIIDEYLAEVSDRQARAGEAGHRGSGQVRVQRVEMLNPEGVARTVIRTGAPAVFRIHYEASGPVADPVFGLAFHAVDGAFVSSSNTRQGGTVAHLELGPGVLDYAVEHLPLASGHYDVGITVYDTTGAHQLDLVDRVLRFTVAPVTPEDEGGVVSFRGDWRGSALHSTRQPDLAR